MRLEDGMGLIIMRDRYVDLSLSILLQPNECFVPLDMCIHACKCERARVAGW